MCEEAGVRRERVTGRAWCRCCVCVVVSVCVCVCRVGGEVCVGGVLECTGSLSTLLSPPCLHCALLYLLIPVP